MSTDKRREARLHKAVLGMSRALWFAEDHPPYRDKYWRDALKAARKCWRMAKLRVDPYSGNLSMGCIAWCERRMKELGVKP